MTARTGGSDPVPGSDPAAVELDNDGVLVQRILAGEEPLFEVLVRRYQARVVAHVTRMVGSRDDAFDLAQEIFLKVLQALDRYNPEF
ncbi:MAG TPA: sigma factor, partial [Thermoanaerobaculia bacterium]|nr:sigma factor [Thermoanaerobaculia bacterium]